MEKTKLAIGTCSWKYASWKGIIYPESGSFNYLEEYSKHYRTVEIDQWFWSLFSGNRAVLPKPEVVQEYATSVPKNFRFGIKVPNSITLSHHYKKKRSESLVRNPHFLSLELMHRFLDRLEPLFPFLGPLMLQFEYLNKQKMAGGLNQFLAVLGEFARLLPTELTYCIETRNPNFLAASYFEFLNHSKLQHVFLHGYFMPPIFEVYKKQRERIRDTIVIRLHGPDRKGIEKQTGKIWDTIIAPKDQDLQLLTTMLLDLQQQKVESFIFVNNHFEGSAPRTIERIQDHLKLVS